MEISKVSRKGDESWITVRSADEHIVIHIQGMHIEWEKKKDTLNIRKKK